MTVVESNINYSIPNFGKDEKLLVFEVSKDMLSFITLYQEDCKDHSYIAKNGVYKSVLFNALEAISTRIERIFV